MRGADITQIALFSYRTMEGRIPQAHPLRRLRAVVDVLLATLDEELDALYAKTGRASIPPEQLPRASLIQILYSVRSERQLVKQIEYNLLYRWFVGLDRDDAVWDHSRFSANRERLLNERIAQRFFERVLLLAEWQQLLSDEHFSVDGTLIEAWASMKSFVKKDGTGAPPEGGGRNPTVDFQGKTQQCHPRLDQRSGGPAVQEDRGRQSAPVFNGPCLDGEPAGLGGGWRGDARHRHRGAGNCEGNDPARTITRSGAAVGADKAYDVPEFVAALWQHRVTPHVAQKAKGSAIDGRTTRHAGYCASLKVRKRVEEIFGWAETVGGLLKTRFRGLEKVRAQTVFTFAA